MKIPAFLCLLLAILAAMPALANPPEDVVLYPVCVLCGMSRERFAHSRGLVEWRGGAKTPVCSLNCAAAALEGETEKTPEAVLIADHGTRRLLDAAKGFWVVGGSERGVMTPLPKWAFAKKEDAEGFVAIAGGELSSYEEALKLAKGDLKVRPKR